MSYSITSERQHDVNEYQLKPQKAKIEIPIPVSLISEIDRAYAFTFKKVSGYMPGPEVLKQTGTLYTYQPDERPYTFRAIGKASTGLSPPVTVTQATNRALNRFTRLKNSFFLLQKTQKSHE